jgi:hypothetical protein
MRRIVVALFVLVGAVQSQTLPLSARRDSLRYSAYEELPLVTTGSDLLTTSRVNRQINMSLAAICRQYPAYEKVDTVICARAVEGGALNADFLRGTMVFRMVGDSMRVPLLPLDLDSIKPLSQEVTKNLQDIDRENDPNQWYTRGYRLYTHPKVRKDSTEADTFIVHYEAMAPRLSADSDTTVIDKNFLEALVYHTVAKLWMLRHRADLAQAYFALAEKSGTEAMIKKAEQRGRE